MVGRVPHAAPWDSHLHAGAVRLSVEQAIANTRGARHTRWPEENDPRSADGAIEPVVRPSFSFERGSKVFTIGSCFARNVEEYLSPYDVPTLRFAAPREEWPHRPNGLLNEYNAGTIAQRIERAFAGTPAPSETVVESGDAAIDLLLPTAITVSRERAFARRAEIDAIYEELPRADVVIVTLGLVEAWFDTHTQCYLNGFPPQALSQGDRYELVIMDVETAYPALERAFAPLIEHEMRVVVTVSPVPLYATFSGSDAVVANSFSKAVLRVCAQRLATLPNVDYFPAYEMVEWRGRASFDDDNTHVRDSVVREIVQSLVTAYAPSE